MNLGIVGTGYTDIVSIITPSYNSSPFIAQTIESILSQTYTNWELLITDDCSTDDTCEIVACYQQRDPRVKLFRLERNSGAGIARNHSLQMAKGRYIAFCDSDDRWYPEKLEKQLAFMEEKGCVLSYTSYMTCDGNGVIRGIVVCDHRVDYRSLKRDDGIGCLTAIYDSSLYGKIYLPNLRKRQDWGLWLKIMEKCKVAYGMKEPLAIYRIHPNSISRNKFSLIGYNIAVYQHVLGYSLCRAYLTFFFGFLPSYFWKKLRMYLVNL
ncbi:glycosyltransferase family 2 protein [Parabacteroides sp.]